jgi:hypothetical protein
MARRSLGSARNHVICVLSCRRYLARRNSIRLTWKGTLERQSSRCRVLFIIGRPGQAAGIEGDCLYVDCEDNYESLPAKTLEAITFCATNLEFEYLFKTDDDVYVNPRNFAQRIPMGYDYFGHPSGTSSDIVRDWHFGKTEGEAKFYEGKYCGPWASGGGYWLSHRACEWLAKNAPSGYARSEVFEDKMVGDLVRGSDLVVKFEPGLLHLTIGQFARFRLGPDRLISAESIELRLEELDRSIALHLGSFGSGKGPVYRIDEHLLEKLFFRIHRYVDSSPVQRFIWRAWYLPRRIFAAVRRKLPGLNPMHPAPNERAASADSATSGAPKIPDA